MTNPLSSLEHFSNFLDFEILIKNTSIYAFQERLKFLISEIEREILQIKVNTVNVDTLDKLISRELEDAIQYSGGDLTPIEPLVQLIFQYDQLNLETSLEIDKIPVRCLLTWAPDSNWSYNEYWAEWIKNGVVELPFYIEAKDIRHYLFELVYQEGIKTLKTKLSIDFTIEETDIITTHNSPIIDSDELLTKQEVAKLIKRSVGTVTNYTNRGLITKINLSKRTIRYQKSEILDKLEELKSIGGKRISKY